MRRKEEGRGREDRRGEVGRGGKGGRKGEQRRGEQRREGEGKVEKGRGEEGMGGKNRGGRGERSVCVRWSKQGPLDHGPPSSHRHSDQDLIQVIPNGEGSGWGITPGAVQSWGPLHTCTLVLSVPPQPGERDLRLPPRAAIQTGGQGPPHKGHTAQSAHGARDTSHRQSRPHSLGAPHAHLCGSCGSPGRSACGRPSRRCRSGTGTRRPPVQSRGRPSGTFPSTGPPPPTPNHHPTRRPPRSCCACRTRAA